MITTAWIWGLEGIKRSDQASKQTMTFLKSQDSKLAKPPHATKSCYRQGQGNSVKRHRRKNDLLNVVSWVCRPLSFWGQASYHRVICLGSIQHSPAFSPGHFLITGRQQLLLNSPHPPLNALHRPHRGLLCSLAWDWFQPCPPRVPARVLAPVHLLPVDLPPRGSHPEVSFSARPALLANLEFI